jgi:hypothetical protein
MISAIAALYARTSPWDSHSSLSRLLTIVDRPDVPRRHTGLDPASTFSLFVASRLRGLRAFARPKKKKDEG